MKKENQSLLDFIQILPEMRSRNVLSRKEANTLLGLWDSEKDEYGNIILDNSTDPMVIAALTTKGLLKTKQNMIGIKTIMEVTKTGKEVIKSLILQEEKSAFEKTAGTNYGSWFQRALWKSF